MRPIAIAAADHSGARVLSPRLWSAQMAASSRSRSSARAHLLLDKASEEADEALLQWRYSPLVLNGIPTSFVLTVTFNFSVKK